MKISIGSELHTSYQTLGALIVIDLHVSNPMIFVIHECQRKIGILEGTSLS